MKKFIFILFLIFNSANCSAKPVELRNTQVKYLTSKENGIDYKLYISLPEGYYDKENFSYRKNYPVLYVLDGDVEFAMIKNIADTMINFENIEPMIIVGIGYKGQELSKKNSKTFWKNYVHNRTRDYVAREFEIDIKKYWTNLDPNNAEQNNYIRALNFNGENFKNFIEKELISYINKNYRTQNNNALLGHSLGGLFGTFMMLNNSSTFDKYLILSPVIKIGSIIENLDKYSAKEDIKTYFAVGSLEFYENGSMVRDLETFYEKLPKERIQSKMEIIKDEDHMTVLPIGVTKGLKFLFGKNYEKHT